MTDLRVDFSLLDQSQTSLQRIAQEFESAEATRDELATIWGSRDVAGAMRGFVNNWDRHRGGLLSSIQNVGQMCAAAAETFRTLESTLAQVLQPGDGPLIGPPALGGPP